MNLRRFSNRTRKDQDFAEKIESHLAHEEDANLARGLCSEEARRQALLRFGNPQTVREQEWRYRSFPWISDLKRDFLFALRALAKTPGFTAITVLLIAVGIGLNTALFSVINAVLLKPPIINKIYPGPQGGSVGDWSFSSARGDCQALAELGFVVVQIEGMGNPPRSKKFHDFHYGDMGDNTLPDQVAGMRELAAKYPWVDVDRVGIWGHSGGGFASAMFRYPDFFKVGISESGNHDNREYEDDWGERYQGLLMKKSDGITNYDDQANETLAKNLKGHLLLPHGMVDDNVPPYNPLLVVDALIRANKDFDLLLLPNQHHGYGAESCYMTRRRWDYFVRYLLCAIPRSARRMLTIGRDAYTREFCGFGRSGMAYLLERGSSLI